MHNPMMEALKRKRMGGVDLTIILGEGPDSQMENQNNPDLAPEAPAVDGMDDEEGEIEEDMAANAAEKSFLAKEPAEMADDSLLASKDGAKPMMPMQEEMETLMFKGKPIGKIKK